MKNRFSAFLAAAVLALTAAVAAPVMAQEQASAAAPATSAQASAAAPAASVPAAAPAAEGGAAKEVIENPYGLDALWKTGDFVAKGTLIIMIIMSMGSWYILITKTIDQVKLSGQAGEARSKFWKAASVQAGVNSLKDGSPFRFIAESGVKASEHHEGALLEQIDLNTWVSMSIQRAVEKVQSRLQDGLAFLATVGSTAPFVGLFGTVWGILNALTDRKSVV